MMPLLRQTVGAVLAAVVGAVLLYLFLAWLLALPLRPDEKDEQERLADLVKVALGLAAGLGASVALIVGYRRARVDEAASHRDDQRLFDDRYQSAAQLLGHDTAAVRLAGIYAMGRLADDWDDQRQQCIDVLCAYLRLPFDPELPQGGEVEIRLSLVRLIVNHLVPEAPTSWSGERFDFSRATLDGCNFDGAVFAGTVSFEGARFVGSPTTFIGTKFQTPVSFTGCQIDGARVSFEHAEFGGDALFGTAELSGAAALDFTATFFEGPVSFWSATVSSDAAITFFGSHLKGGIYIFGSDLRGLLRFEETAFGNWDPPRSVRVEFDEDRFSVGSRTEFERCLFCCEVVIRSTLSSVVRISGSDMTRATRIRFLSSLDGGGISFHDVDVGAETIIDDRESGNGSIDLAGLSLTESAPEPSVTVAESTTVLRPQVWPRIPDPGPEPPYWSPHGQYK